MQYYVPEDAHAGFPQIVPTWLIVAIACLSSLGFFSRFVSIDSYSMKRLLDYQTTRALASNTLEKGSIGANLRHANHYVHMITEHCQSRDLAPWENWAQWILGQFYSPLMRTQNPVWIVYGGKGDCSERSAVLQDLLWAQGIQSRFIGLGGHVVLEAQSQTETWILDPDYGLAIKTGIDEFENQASGELSGWLVGQGIAPCESLEYEQIVGSKDDNVRLDWNVPLSPRLKKVESLCEIAVWLVPLLCWVWIGWNLRPAQ